MEKTMMLKTSSIARLCGTAAALLVLGCGSSSSNNNNGGDPSKAFTGSWTFSSGSIQPVCNVTVPAVDLTGDTMMITKVSDTEVSTTLNGTGLMCNVNFNISGTTATAVAGQTCTVTESVMLGATPTNVTVLIHITNWTLNVSGNTLTIAMNGTAADSTGLLTCSPTADGSATRAGDGGA
jgi:hypothetical protein